MQDRFLSNFVNRIDAKGRVSVPASFRATAGRRGYSDFYAVRALGVPAMDAGGPDLLDRYEARIASQDPLAQLSDDISLVCHGEGTFLKIDKDGRITISDFLRAHTGIGDDIAFVGRGSFFQIWEPQRFADHLAQARARLEQMRQSTVPER